MRLSGMTAKVQSFDAISSRIWQRALAAEFPTSGALVG
jgi:hypothetical protein